jgi:hypothetical protein
MGINLIISGIMIIIANVFVLFVIGLIIYYWLKGEL